MNSLHGLANSVPEQTTLMSRFSLANQTHIAQPESLKNESVLLMNCSKDRFDELFTELNPARH